MNHLMDQKQQQIYHYKEEVQYMVQDFLLILKYHIYENKIVVYEGRNTIFDGTWPDFIRFANKPEDTEESV